MASRRIVGFAVGEHHDAPLAYAALSMAVAVRGGKDAVAGVIMHSDYPELCVMPRMAGIACAGRAA
jgi:hypothetical protein